MASVFDRWKLISGIRLRTVRYENWQPEVRALLEGMGFGELLELADMQGYNPTAGVGISRYQSGKSVQTESAGRLSEALIPTIISANPLALSQDDKLMQKAELYGALIEAIENTTHHAYPDDFQGATVVPNWWFAGHLDPENNEHLTIAAYDLGISIPGSLASYRRSRWPGHEFVNGIISRFIRISERDENEQDDTTSDAVKLRLAMRYAYSSTGKAHRGKGLRKVLSPLSHCRQGRLHILSRKAEFVMEKGRRGVARQMPWALPGTLLIWDLWL